MESKLTTRDDLKVTCGLTPCTPGSAPGPTLGKTMGELYFFRLVLSSVVLVMIRVSLETFCDPILSVVRKIDWSTSISIIVVS